MDLAKLLARDETVRLRIEAPEVGERLDSVLRGHFPFASRAEVQRWIAEGRVFDGEGRRLRASKRLRPGQTLVVRPVKTLRDLDDDISELVERLALVHDGGDFGVVRKPPKVLAHPSGGTIRRTVLTAVGLRYAERIEAAGPWLPHRLDFETAGLQLVAFTAAAAGRLSRGLAARKIERRYLARVRGSVPFVRARLDARLRVVPGRPSRVVVDAQGAEALTLVAVVERDAATTLLDVEPITGRMHQIRVHLADAGHAIVGDPLHDPAALAEARLHLHAVSIVLPAAVASAPEAVVVRVDPRTGDIP